MDNVLIISYLRNIGFPIRPTVITHIHNKSSEISRCSQTFPAMFFRRKVAKLLRKVVGQVFNPAKASRSKKPALVLMPRRALCLTFCIDSGWLRGMQSEDAAALCHEQCSCAGQRQGIGIPPEKSIRTPREPRRACCYGQSEVGQSKLSQAFGL